MPCANAANLTLQGAIQSVLIVSNNASNEDNLWNGYGSYYPITYAQYQQDSIHRKAAQLATPAPNPSAVSSERLFIIAEDANGNTIFNPTTYNQNIILTLSLNGKLRPDRHAADGHRLSARIGRLDLHRPGHGSGLLAV